MYFIRSLPVKMRARGQHGELGHPAQQHQGLQDSEPGHRATRVRLAVELSPLE